MTCYICSASASKFIRASDITFGYCDTHSQVVQIGIVRYLLSGSLSKLNSAKRAHLDNLRSAASLEFDKQKEIERKLFDEDSSITEQDF
jgi:hypothetical protein